MFSSIFLVVIITLCFTSFSSSFSHLRVEATCITGENASVPLFYQGSQQKVLPGFYAPKLDVTNSSTFPIACVPSRDCQVKRTLARFCKTPQSPFEPIPCPEGYYCPNATQKKVCPEGYFCMLGSISPRRCPLLASCPEETVRPFNLGPLVALIIVLLAVLASCIGYQYRTLSSSKKISEFHAWGISPSSSSSSSALLAPSASSSSAINIVPENSASILSPEASLTSPTATSAATAAAGGGGMTVSPSSSSSPFASAASFASSSSMVTSGSSSSFSANLHRSQKRHYQQILNKGISRANKNKTMTFDISNLSVSLNNYISTSSSSSSHNSNKKTTTTTTKKKKKIVTDITCQFRPGCVSSICSPSGGGKSTLLKALLGKLDPDVFSVAGDFLINGEKEMSEEMRKSIAYVPQDDVLFGELTVYQNLYYSSELSLPRDWTMEEKDEYREAVLHLLKLSKSRNTLVGDAAEGRGVSGGEKKRLAIGIALCTAPCCMILDEPTSPVSSTAALEIVQLLKEISVIANITVISVLHQIRSEIFDILDRLLVLAPGGKTVYEGKGGEACLNALSLYVPSRVNPADFLMDSVTLRAKEMYADFLEVREKKLEIEQENKKEEKRKEQTSEEKKPKEVKENEQTFFRQTYLFLARAISVLLSQYKFLLLEFVILIVLSFILASGAEQFTPTASYKAEGNYIRLSPSFIESFLPQLLLYTLMAMSLLASTSGCRIFGDDLEKFSREADSLSITAYYIGVSIAHTIRISISVLIVAGLIFSFGRWPTTENNGFNEFYANFFLLYFFMSTLGQIVSLFVSQDYAATNAATLTLVFCSLSGFFRSFPQGLKYLSPAFFSCQALYVDYMSTIVHWSSPPYDLWGYDKEMSTAENLGIMAGFAVAGQFVVLVSLHYLFRPKVFG